MNSVKGFHSLLVLILLTISSAFAQTSGTATKPAATTSTNRQQELYDQYHGVTKKTTSTTTPTTSPAATPVQPQRQASSSYGSTQPAATDARSQRVSTDASTSGVRIGVRGGVTKIFYLENQPFVKSTIGFVGGLTFNFGTGTVSFQPEVNYARYSAKLKDNSLGLDLKGDVDVIEVPLLLKISSGSYAGSRFFVNLGPYGSYLASRSTNGKKESLAGEKGRFGYGAAAGVGAALKAGPGHVIVEVRGMYPFGDTESGFSTDAKTILSQGTVGYSFPLGGR